MTLVPAHHLVLAPMQGLADPVMRDLLTRIGGFDECVTEFVRITHTVHNRPTWLKYMPELATHNRTPAGVPVTLQILGSDADNMAVNALNAVRYGAERIDLNFGCPAPTVNRHAGGAVLLRQPQLIEHIVRTLRQRLPAHIRLSAKMRLGYEDKTPALACARAIENGGAQALTVHARTKAEGYAPPAHWDWVARIRETISIPLTANGDVFSLADYRAIKAASGCTRIMIGRGAITVPDLARQIADFEHGRAVRPLDWPQLLPWIRLFFDISCQKASNNTYPQARLKQWLGMMKSTYPEAALLFARIRTLKETSAVRAALAD